MIKQINYLILVTILFFISVRAHALDIEKKILNLSSQNNFYELDLSSKIAQAKSDYYLNQRKYDFSLEIDNSFVKNNRQALASFDFVPKRQNILSSNISKKFKYGFDIKAGYSQQRFDLSSDRIYRPQSYVSLDISLLKNLLGKIDQAQDLSYDLKVKNSQIQKKYELNNFYNQIRTLFWEYYFNHLQILLSQEFEKNANAELELVNKRFKKGFFNRSDLNKAKSVLYQRKSNSTIAFDYQNNLEQQIKYLAPQILPLIIDFTSNEKNAESHKKIIKNSKYCLNIVKNDNYLEYSSIFAIIKNLKKIKKLDKEVANSVSNSDLYLSVKHEGYGLDNSSSEASSDALYFYQNATTASINWKLPLGPNQSKSISNSQKYIRDSYNSQIMQLTNILTSSQSLFLVKMNNLSNYINNLEKQASELKKQLNFLKKRFRQGKISYLDLVREENNLNIARSSLIESNRLYIISMISYFDKFDQLPCEFNISKNIL